MGSPSFALFLGTPPKLKSNPNSKPSSQVSSPVNVTNVAFPSSLELVRSLSSPGLQKANSEFEFEGTPGFAQPHHQRVKCHVRKKSLSETQLLTEQEDRFYNINLGRTDKENSYYDNNSYSIIPPIPPLQVTGRSVSPNPLISVLSDEVASISSSSITSSLSCGSYPLPSEQAWSSSLFNSGFYPQLCADSASDDSHLISTWTSTYRRKSPAEETSLHEAWSTGGLPTSHSVSEVRTIPVASANHRTDEQVRNEDDLGNCHCSCSMQRRESLENEEDEDDQLELNHSLLALTTHLAQVQFRLRQIIQCDNEERDELLKELEEFAFQGCQNLTSYNISQNLCSDFERRLSQQKAKHEELIFQLKFQLQDLETFACEASVARTTEQIQRHQLVLENLRKYLQLDINDIYMLTTTDLQVKIDNAIQNLLSPLRTKEQMLYQLSTQVQDLERFIEFLQDTGITPNALSHEIRRCTCNCPLHGDVKPDSQTVGNASSKTCSFLQQLMSTSTTYREESISIISKTLLMLQVVLVKSLQSVTWFLPFQDKHPGYMNYIRKLEESVDQLIRVYSCDNDTSQDIILDIVRKQLAGPLKALFSHGLRSKKKDSLILSCTNKHRAGPNKKLGVHPWNLFLEYYVLQHGPSLTQQPQYQLSQSFGLRIHRQSINSKQSLLCSIYKVNDTHEPYRRSHDAKFRSLLIHGINEGLLGQWCKQITQCDTLLQLRYESWSFMRKNGFLEAIKILDRLSSLRLNLPADIALKIFYVPQDIENPIY